MRTRASTRAAAVALLTSMACAAFLGAQVSAGPDVAASQSPADAPPLYDDLGDLHYEIRTVVPATQAYFDQGLRLYYAFNHLEAIASFKEAQRLDPQCAMCWWGEALAWGPNINLPMDVPSAVEAYMALREAGSRVSAFAEKEQMLIETLSLRYAAVPTEDRAVMDSLYADAMRELTERFPEDDDIAVLYGESVMDLSPWDYWTDDGQLRPGMEDALSRFESVLEHAPDHPGACHFFIHAVEKVQPERAVPCAERLAALMPGAGHLVHMPGHIYIRVGRYLDAIETNEHAVHADETWIRDRRPSPGMYTSGYYPHNYDFLAFAAVMVGQGDQAIEAADRVAALLPEEMLGDPSMVFVQHYVMRSLLIRARFGRWEEILAALDPGEALPHARAIWEYARGRALIGIGDLEGAKRELARLRAAAEGSALSGVRLEFNESQEILGIAERVLAGRVEEAEGRHDSAAEFLRDAVRGEDTLLYGEPPEWTTPVRQELGEVLLAAGRPDEVEEAFRGDLDRFPENGWSLAGLAKALDDQGRGAEARVVERRFREIWPGDAAGPFN